MVSPFIPMRQEGNEGSHVAARSGRGAWRASAAVGRHGVAGTSPEAMGAGRRHAPAQNRCGRGACQVSPRHSNGQRSLKLI
jgi:hypothetical protein